MHFTTNLRNLQNNLHAPFYPFHFSSIVLAYRIHDLNEDFAYILLRFKVGCCSRWTFKSSFCCHWKFAMFFRGTITIEWNGQRQPLKTMVFRWFWVSQPLVMMVFRWLTTIGPTMDWLNTFVKSTWFYSHDNDCTWHWLLFLCITIWFKLFGFGCYAMMLWILLHGTRKSNIAICIAE